MRTIFFYIAFILLFSWNLNAQDNPVASPAAIVITKNARFTILTPELLRMEYSSVGKFEDHASLVFINRNLPVPQFSKKLNNKTLTIKTEKLTLVYKNDGQPFNQNNLSIKFINCNKKSVIWKPGLVDSLNLKGTCRTLDGDNGWDFEKNLENGILSRSGWAVVDDSKSNLFDGSEDFNWVKERTDSVFDWYIFVYNNNYKKALSDYTKIAGKIPMPPKFAFGYWWSRYWIYNDKEMRKLVQNFKDFNIPIDVLVIDMDWHDTYNFNSKKMEIDPMGQWKGWTGYTWNKNLFPDPENFLKWTNEEHLKTALNLHPASGIPSMEEKYGEFAKSYGFDTTRHEYIPYKMSEKKWAKTYFDVILKPMEEMGIDFWWLDWQQGLNDKQIPGLSNTWWLNYTFFTNMEKSGKRPLLFHRWGGMGNHRYQIGFSGDTNTSWETLDFESYFTATASNVGYGYWSHDIGGHQTTGQPTDGELYLRWIQFGVLSPILRTHATKISLIERRFWMFPNHFEAMREAIKFRYSLVPYIYKYAREAFDTGISICRPMYYDYPEVENAYTHKTQYMFGDEMIAAPVSTPISTRTFLAKKSVWLPEGNWFEYCSGSLLKGNQIYERNYAEYEIPLFVKAGSIIPMNPEVKNLQEKPEILVITFIPGTNKELTTLYDDNGNTDEYKKSGYSTRLVSKEISFKRTMKITLEPMKGSYKDMPLKQAYELRLLNTILPVSVTLNGQPCKFNYSNKDLASIIHVPTTSVREKFEVIVNFDVDLDEQQTVLNGNKGLMRRIEFITEKLKINAAATDWGGTLPNLVYGFDNFNNVIFYYPDQVFTEMQKLNVLKKKMIQVYSDITNIDEEKIVPLIEHLELTK
ncbi:MAG TPA: TIM-barrel domain-containing protein [Paludibacter sp.]